MFVLYLIIFRAFCFYEIYPVTGREALYSYSSTLSSNEALDVVKVKVTPWPI
jgi:hypothetical protein